MQYDNQLLNLKTVLPSAKNILIALPTGSNVDKLAAGLALYLSLISQGKEVTIVCEDNILVGQAHLFAIDKIQKTISGGQGGNFVITLEGVATQGPNGGTVPSLDKLDYFVEGNNLNLVFRVIPGQTFNPAKIVPQYKSSGGYEVVFTLGAISLNNLGSIYANNMQAFNGPHIVNVDNNQANTNFGQTNIIDFSASSISEIVANMMPSLGLSYQGDVATNMLTGIFDTTANMTSANANAGTYEAVSNLMKSGGQRPQAGGFNVNPTGFPQVSPNFVEQAPVMQPFAQAMPQPQVNQQSGSPAFDFKAMAAQTQYDLSAFVPQTGSQTESFPVPPVVPSNQNQPQNTPSQEERPAGEGVITEAEPDWLTPKIFKGTSIG